MEDILREALMYVSSDKKEEIPDPKAAKGGKGKPAEAVTELFVGQDTTIYKEIALNLLKQIQVTTG